MNKVITYISLIVLILVTSCETKMDEQGDDTNQNVDPNVLLLEFKCQSIQDFFSDYSVPDSLARHISYPSEYENVVNAGKIMVPSLIQMLLEKNESIQYAALLALTQITNKDYGCIGVYYIDREEIIKNKEKIVEEWTNWWNENKNKSRVEWLLDDLHSDENHIKVNAIMELGNLREVSAKTTLRSLLEDDDFAFCAAYSLGQLGDYSSIPFLISMYLKSDSYGNRREGIDLLEELTSQTFGYDPNASKEKRQQSIRKWEEWWEENKAQYM